MPNNESPASSPAKGPSNGSSVPVSPASASTALTNHSVMPAGTHPRFLQLMQEHGQAMAGIFDPELRAEVALLYRDRVKLDQVKGAALLNRVLGSLSDNAVKGRVLELFLNELLAEDVFSVRNATWNMNDLTPLVDMHSREPGYTTRYIRVTTRDLSSTEAAAALVNSFADFWDLVRVECPALNECTEMRRSIDDQLLFFYEDVRMAKLAHMQCTAFEELFPELCFVDFVTARVYNSMSRSPVLYPHNGHEATIRVHAIIPNERGDDMTFIAIHAMLLGLLADVAMVRTITGEIFGDKIAWCTYYVEFYSIEHGLRFLEVTNRTKAFLPGPAVSGIVRAEIPFPSELLCISDLVTRGVRGDIEIPRSARFPINRRTTLGAHHMFWVRPDDVRTTLMLRNIPNAMTSYELKNLIDGIARHRYNFLYLRMDFQTGNNVGYGFVNFDDPGAAIEFAYKFQGLTWVIGHTTKVAAVSYATTQGKENQISRFRNSGLRLQPAPNRPKLFVSIFDFPEMSLSSRALGEEIPLPDVDNRSKLNRSVMNGRNNGLYSRARRVPHGSPMQGLFDNGNPHNPQEDPNAVFPYQHQLPPFF